MTREDHDEILADLRNDLDELHAIVRALRRCVEEDCGVWGIKQYCAPNYDKALTKLFEAAHAL